MCERCQAPLNCSRRYQQRRFCSRTCAILTVGRTPSPMPLGATSRAIIAILEANRDRPWWITYPDLAILCYGDDSDADIHGIRMAVSVLRRRGYRFAERRLEWLSPGRQWTTGFRLVGAPSKMEAAA